MTNKNCKTIQVSALVLFLMILGRANAAPNRTYELVAQFTSQDALPCSGVALNNKGDVAYQTSEVVDVGGGSDWLVKTYIRKRGTPPQLVHQGLIWSGEVNPIASPLPNLGGNVGCGAANTRPLGLNDDAIVSIPVHWIAARGERDSEITAGYLLVDSDGDVVRQIRGIRGSSGRLNSDLQLAGAVSEDGSALRVSDGITSQDTGVLGFLNVYEPIINNNGAAVTLGIAGGDLHLTLVDPSNPNSPLATTLGSASIGPWYTDSRQLGFNDRNWMSFAGNTDNNLRNPTPRVVLISPEALFFPVADTSQGILFNFYQGRFSSFGTSLNNFNRVLFAASRRPDPGTGSDSLWIGDASGDPPDLVLDAEEVITLDGRDFTGFALTTDNPRTGVNANSLNDAGEFVYLAGTTSSLAILRWY